ncbi:hypothetical protein KUA24_1 [Vibrio phage HNL01]|nr:hypothetical protein KUA24_1 [Vibrio phage HNL01]
MREGVWMRDTKVVVDYPLNKKQYELLMKVVNNTKCFDRKDNTFLLSNRKIAERLRVSASGVDQLFRVLKKEGLLKGVVTSYMNTKPVKMLSPRFLWISYTKTDRYYCSVLYKLGCVQLADEWRLLCRELGGYVDVNTGEINFDFTWHYIDEIASRYTCWDVCYRRQDSKVSLDDHEDSSQGYNLKELGLEEVTLKDMQWFEEVNKGSKFVYPKELSMNCKPKFKSMYVVPLEGLNYDDCQ